MSRMYLSIVFWDFPVYKYDFDRIVWYFRRLSSCRFLLCCSDFLPADLQGKLRGSYSILGDFDEDNRDGGIGRNWLGRFIRIQNISL